MKQTPVNLSLTSQSHRNIQVCDQCHQFKRKCDRKLPKCSLCVDRGLECTRERKLQRQQFMQQDTNFYNYVFNSLLLTRKHKKNKGTKVKVKQQDKIEDNIKSKENIEHIFEVKTKEQDKQINEVKVKDDKIEDKIILKGKIIELINDKNNNYCLNKQPKLKFNLPKFDIASMSVSRFPIYSFIVILKSQHKLKKLYDINPEASIFFFLKSLNLPTSNEPEINLPLVYYNSNYQPIIQHSILLYFKLVNITFPLFSIDDFYNKPRSILLKSTLSLVGLTLMEQTKEVQILSLKLKNLIHEILNKWIKNPNLKWIQILIVLANGLRGHPYSPPNYLLFDLIKICHSIGLHLKPSNKLPFHIQVERQLAYSAALYFDTNSNPSASGCFNHSNIWINPLIYKFNLIKYFEYELLMIMGEFRYNLAKDLFNIFQMFKKVEQNKYNKVSVLKEIQYYFDNVKHFSLNAFMRLYKLKKSFINHQHLLTLVDVVLNSIGLLSNSVYVPLYELKRNLTNKEEEEDIKENLKCIERSYQYNFNLQLQPYSSNRIFSVYNNIRILASYYHYSKKCDTLIKKGLELFYFLRLIPTFKASVHTCLSLIQILFDALNINIPIQISNN